MASALWAPAEWVRPEIDGIRPRVINYGARDGFTDFYFYVHDHSQPESKGAVLAHGPGKTLEAAQAACDAAMVKILAERAQSAAMVAEGVPEAANDRNATEAPTNGN